MSDHSVCVECQGLTACGCSDRQNPAWRTESSGAGPTHHGEFLHAERILSNESDEWMILPPEERSRLLSKWKTPEGRREMNKEAREWERNQRDHTLDKDWIDLRGK